MTNLLKPELVRQLKRVKVVVRKELNNRYWLQRGRLSGAVIGNGSSMNFRTILNDKTRLRNNFNSNGLWIQGPGAVTIGDNFHCGRNCMILTSNHNYKGDALPYDKTDVVADTTIGDNVWLGHNVIILPGVSIGEGVVVQTAYEWMLEGV